MTNEGGPHETGRHLLGPHVIGQRVVIRRLVRDEVGPTGGPAFADLLGVCIGWADGTAIVRPESGTDVEIPIADIVSGKPVPPRPSVRSRVTVAEAESHTAALFPGLETAALGSWTLRAEPRDHGRMRRRANSALALEDPGIPIAAAADGVAQFYADRGRTPYLHVEADSDIETSLRALGWRADPTGDAHFMLASLARVRRQLSRSPGGAAREASLTFDATDRVSAVVEGGCDPIAEGAAQLDGDWIGLYGLVVEPGHRRRGLATAVLASLLEWGAEQGAMTAWLHVETGNSAALALYEALGFLPHHTMRYLTR